VKNTTTAFNNLNDRTLNLKNIVGGLAATLNHFNHLNRRVTSCAFFGLLLVYIANGGRGAPFISFFPDHVIDQLDDETALHQFTNVMGCAFLLTSNYIGRQIGGCGDESCAIDHGNGISNGTADKSCGGDNGHGHGHGHDHSHDHGHGHANC